MIVSEQNVEVLGRVTTRQNTEKLYESGNAKERERERKREKKEESGRRHAAIDSKNTWEVQKLLPRGLPSPPPTTTTTSCFLDEINFLLITVGWCCHYPIGETEQRVTGSIIDPDRSYFQWIGQAVLAGQSRSFMLFLINFLPYIYHQTVTGGGPLNWSRCSGQEWERSRWEGPSTYYVASLHHQ